VAAVAVLALALVVAGRTAPPGNASTAALRGARAQSVQLTSTTAAAVRRPAGVTDESLGRGLVGYWRFDEPAGSRFARDLSGHGMDCELHELDPAIHWVPGVMGGAINVNGRGWLECPQVSGLASITRELTVAAWVHMDRLRPDLASVVAWQRGDGQDYEFFLGLYGGNLLLASAVWARLEWAMPPIIGRWVHLAATRAADGTRRLYFDGVEVARKGRRPDLLHAIGGALILGGRAKSTEPREVRQRLDGAIDELVIYDRALAAEEIAGLVAHHQPVSR
jgi:hypothetical protein